MVKVVQKVLTKEMLFSKCRVDAYALRRLHKPTRDAKTGQKRELC